MAILKNISLWLLLRTAILWEHFWMTACKTQPPRYIHFKSSNDYIQFQGVSRGSETVRDIENSTRWEITEKKIMQRKLFFIFLLTQTFYKQLLFFEVICYWLFCFLSVSITFSNWKTRFCISEPYLQA